MCGRSTSYMHVCCAYVCLFSTYLCSVCHILGTVVGAQDISRLSHAALQGLADLLFLCYGCKH